MDYQPILKTITKLVGTTFNNRQALLARVKAENLETIILAREPSNMYDPEAITASVTFHDGTTAVIGHIQNSDRMCLGTLKNGQACGAVIEGSIVSKSRTVACPGCGLLFTADKYNTVIKLDGPDKIKWTTCSVCNTQFRYNKHNIFVHSCGGYQNVRCGLASSLCRGMEEGLEYSARILEVTGGEIGEDGKQHSLGCNIRIEAKSLVGV
jgi:uncharacterized Zn-finger protein